jgi:hypothetical protein
MYQASTGQQVRAYPSLPSAVTDEAEMRQVVELNAIVIKACQANPRARYPSAAEMHAELVRLRSRLGCQGVDSASSSRLT